MVRFKIAACLALMISCAHGSPERRLARVVYKNSHGCPRGMICMYEEDANRLGNYLRELEEYSARCTENDVQQAITKQREVGARVAMVRQIW